MYIDLTTKHFNNIVKIIFNNADLLNVNGKYSLPF